MGNTNGGKFPRALYNLNVVRSKSGDKYKKAYEGAVFLLKKQIKEGETKRVINAKAKLWAKCKKYGISQDMLSNYIEKKGLKDLLPLVSKIPG